MVWLTLVCALCYVQSWGQLRRKSACLRATRSRVYALARESATIAAYSGGKCRAGASTPCAATPLMPAAMAAPTDQSEDDGFLNKRENHTYV